MSLPEPLNIADFDRFVGGEFDTLVTAVEAVGGSVRVVVVDGEPRIITLEYDPMRLNVSITGPQSIVDEITGVG